MPCPLLVSAAATPATWVAWSLTPPPRTTWPFCTAYDPTTLPARSGWVASTPPSMTTISAPAPVEVHQAQGKPAWVRPHCRPVANQGSLGALVAAATAPTWVASTAQTAAAMTPGAHRPRPLLFIPV